MKKPIFTEHQRSNIDQTTLQSEIAKLKFKRAFENTGLGKFMRLMVNWLAKILSSNETNKIK
jgi:hypothetical protein